LRFIGSIAGMLDDRGLAMNKLRIKEFGTVWRQPHFRERGLHGYPGSVQIATPESVGRRLLPRMVRLPPDRKVTASQGPKSSKKWSFSPFVLLFLTYFSLALFPIRTEYYQ